MTTIPTALFRSATATASKVADHRHRTASHVHLHPNDAGLLTISATDIDTLITQTIGNETTDIDVGVLAQQLAVVASKCPGETTTLTVADGELRMVSGRWRTAIRTIPADEIQPIMQRTATADRHTATADAHVLAQMQAVSHVALAAAANRVALSSVRLEPYGEGLWIVATDSYRLSLRHHAGVMVDAPASIPSSAVALIAATHDGDDGIDIHTSTHTATFAWAGTSIHTSLIVDDYPQWQPLVDAKQGDSTLAIDDTAEAAKAVDRAAKFATDGRPVTLHLAQSGVRISATTSDVGTSTEEIDATWDGPDTDVDFNPTFLAHAITNFGEPVQATLGTKPDLHPTIWRPTFPSNDLHLLMPTRTT